MPQPLKTRSIKKELLILAPVDAVWTALTDAGELTRWFPLEASVTPGVGGIVHMSWRNEYQFDAPIAVWEPNRRLRLIHQEPSKAARPGEAGLPFDVPFQIGVDYCLDDRAGETLLHLEHFGFPLDETWDAQYASCESGWDFQFQGLKLYLERHRGTPRACVVSRAMIPHIAVKDAWAALWSANGLMAVEHPAPSQPGRRYAMTTSSGDRIEGVVRRLDPPRDFTATATNLNDAWMRVQMDDLPLFNKRDVTIWMSTYALPESRVRSLQQHFDEMLARLFAHPGESRRLPAARGRHAVRTADHPRKTVAASTKQSLLPKRSRT